MDVNINQINESVNSGNYKGFDNFSESDRISVMKSWDKDMKHKYLTRNPVMSEEEFFENLIKLQMGPMEEKKYEYMLGVNDFGGFDIFEHCLNPSPHQGGVTIVFGVDYSGMRDGDGHPARYEKSEVKTITESVYDEAMRIFKETGKNMCALANEAQGLDREFKEGDYLYKGGSFIFIEGLSSLTGKCWIKTFYYDYYDLSIDTDTEIYPSIDEWLDEFDFEDISEFKVIKKEIYERALNIAKSGILEVKDYLKNILTGK